MANELLLVLAVLYTKRCQGERITFDLIIETADRLKTLGVDFMHREQLSELYKELATDKNFMIAARAYKKTIDKLEAKQPF